MWLAIRGQRELATIRSSWAATRRHARGRTEAKRQQSALSSHNLRQARVRGAHRAQLHTQTYGNCCSGIHTATNSRVAVKIDTRQVRQRGAIGREVTPRDIFGAAHTDAAPTWLAAPATATQCRGSAAGLDKRAQAPRGWHATHSSTDLGSEKPAYETRSDDETRREHLSPQGPFPPSACCSSSSINGTLQG